MLEPTGADPADWEASSRRTAAPGHAPVLSVEGFEGPLDWLLDLARTRRIDLARLSIAALIDAFADALTSALADLNRHPRALARCGDWLVMAADLTLLRSRLLVAEDPNQDREAHIAAETLRRQLLTRAAMAAAADWLQQRDQLGCDVFEGRALVVMQTTLRVNAPGTPVTRPSCPVPP